MKSQIMRLNYTENTMLRNSGVAVLVIAMLGFTQCASATDEFSSFWEGFKTAVKKRDKEALARMTQLPFYYDSKNLQKAQFIAKLDEILPGKLSNCFSKEKPVKDKDSYSAFCGEQIYVFSKVNGKYLFTDIGVND
ncbi:MAG: hypothetical protein K2X27_23365 [Candidatus Obscuribacterales bacterium]|nr:hypothetical protein [Candidatus Obscuribacterales bacterium]